MHLLHLQVQELIEWWVAVVREEYLHSDRRQSSKGGSHCGHGPEDWKQARCSTKEEMSAIHGKQRSKHLFLVHKPPPGQNNDPCKSSEMNKGARLLGQKYISNDKNNRLGLQTLFWYINKLDAVQRKPVPRFIHFALADFHKYKVPTQI